MLAVTLLVVPPDSYPSSTISPFSYEMQIILLSFSSPVFSGLSHVPTAERGTLVRAQHRTGVRGQQLR